MSSLISSIADGISRFLFEVDENQAAEIVDLLTGEVQRLHASAVAIHKCENMIADAIAKSEIFVYSDGKLVNDLNYYRLNIQPNDNECGTDFWGHVTKRLLRTGECVIAPIDDKFYVASSWQASEDLLKPKRYTNITLCSCDVTFDIRKAFRADQIIHIRYHNYEIRKYLDNLLKEFDKTITAVNSLVSISATPKLKLQLDANVSLADSKTKQKISADEFADKLLRILKEDQMSIFRLGNGMTLEQLKLDFGTGVGDLEKLLKDVDEAAAKAYNIPITVYNGTVTEKSDADNEFMTYAVEPIAEVINDSLNAKLVGVDDYIEKNERIMVFTGNHKHRDVLDGATNAEKLRGIGFTFDEILKMFGYMPLNTEFSTTRALTKNFSTELEMENEEH